MKLLNCPDVIIQQGENLPQQTCNGNDENTVAHHEGDNPPTQQHQEGGHNFSFRVFDCLQEGLQLMGRWQQKQVSFKNNKIT